MCAEVLVYAAGSEPPCLNILIPACSSGSAGWGVPELVLKGAFSFAPGNSLRAQLVSSVEFTKTPPFTLTYHIRPEAHWSDGVQISAKDFVFTHQAIRKYQPFPGEVGREGVDDDGVDDHAHGFHIVDFAT